MNLKICLTFAFACISYIFSPSASAQVSNKSDQSNFDLRLNHIAIYVNNLKTSTNFYENVLRLKQIPEPFKDGLHTWFAVGSWQLHLIQGAPAKLQTNKNDHLCFSVKSLDDFIDNLNRFKVEYTNWPGTAKAPTVRVDGVKQIYFQDPDGHWIEINDEHK